MADAMADGEVAEEELAAARALVAGLTAQVAATPDGLRALRAEYERLAQDLAAARTECAGALEHLAEADAQQVRLQRELGSARTEIDGLRALLDGLGPTGLGVARRLHRAAERFPTAARGARALLRGAASVRRR